MSASSAGEKQIVNAIEEFLAQAFSADPDVNGSTGETGRFGGRGVRWRGRLFAMPWEGSLAVKLTRDQAEAYCADGLGYALVMGNRTMRDWVLVTERRHWTRLALEARKTVVGPQARPKPRGANKSEFC